MFDERNGRWIRIYKGLAIAAFFICLAIGIIYGIAEAWSFSVFIVFAALGGFIGFVQLAGNMLLIQFFNNVNIIREKIEKM